MSAITGIFYRNNRSVEFDQIKKMNDSLSHRGPDGSNVLNYKSIALGHQMLYTTKESLKENLPFKDESGLIITADARIDNRKELADQLNIDNSPENSDSQFIIEAYKKWGEKCPEKLLGDFAFAIWDIEEQKLFCARDHMGIKSFYYYLTDDALFFATEIRALFSNPEVKCKLNEMKIPFYLSASEEKSTFFEDIISLNASESMAITSSSIEIKKYWELDPNYEIVMKSEEEYIKAFKDIFSEAIDCRLRSAYPVGFELSGGLDSSSVVCMAKKNLKIQEGSLNKLKTFSIIFKGFSRGDESHYIQKVIDKGGIDPHFIDGTNTCLIKNIEDILNHQEQPYYAPFLPAIYKSYQKMRENNIRILLGGMGGDHIVSYGQKYLIDLLLSFKWRKLIKEVRYFSKNQGMNFFDILKMQIIFPLIPANLKESLKRIFSNKYSKKHFSLIFNKNFIEKLNNEQGFSLKHIELPEEQKNAKEFHYSLIRQITNINTIEMLDHGTAAYLIEPRYPYLDKRLVEYCYGIPSEMKFKFGWKRYIQRVAMEGILPSKIQWRSKKGVLSDVLQENLFLFEKNSDEIIDNIKLEEYVNLDIIKEIYYNYKSGDKINTYILWKLLLLSQWLDKYIS